MGAGAENCTPTHDVVDFRLAALERGLSANTEALRDVSAALNRLAVLEERHLETKEGLSRAFVQIESQEERLRAIEVALPPLRELRGWVIRGILAGLGMLGLAVLKLVVFV